MKNSESGVPGTIDWFCQLCLRMFKNQMDLQLHIPCCTRTQHISENKLEIFNDQLEKVVVEEVPDLSETIKIEQVNDDTPLRHMS